MNTIISSSASHTLVVACESNGCQHEFTVRLGCEQHAYRHTWGWACHKCWMQAFYSDLDACCEEDEETP